MVFVLCVAFSTVASAENPCAYCLEQTGVDDGQYTPAVELEGFTVYIPAEFESIYQTTIYETRNSEVSASTGPILYIPDAVDAHFDDADEWYQFWVATVEKSRDLGHDMQLLQTDSFLAIIRNEHKDWDPSFFGLDWKECHVLNVEISNGENWLDIIVKSETPEAVQQLAEGIARHVVLTNAVDK